MAKDVTFRIRIEGSDEVKKVTVDTEELGAAFHSVQQATDDLKGSIVNLAAITQTVEAAQRSVSELQSAMAGLASAYAAQESAESKLQTVMRNTMGASDAEIQSIKDLASAQQQLGVIGDEVQLAGAQELATYLSKTETLKKLIPVMNDMVAQQYGLEASQESAAQIATMLGKVMEGQTTALSRYGYSFTEAQEEILKFGTEEERAATLAEVVSQSVGGVNEELAKTDSGRMKQLENTLGDIQERLGAVATAAMPALTIISQITMSAAGIAKLAVGVKSLADALSVNLQRALTLSISGMRRLITVTGSATKAKLALRAASLGLAGVLAGALAAGIGLIVKKHREAKNAALEHEQAERDLGESVAASRAELELDIARLGAFNGSETEAASLVQELNEKYGDRLGMEDSIAGWYDNLSGKIDVYCTKLANEIELEKLANDTAQLKLKNADLQAQADALPDTKLQPVIGGGLRSTATRVMETVPNKDKQDKLDEIEANNALIETYEQRMQTILSNISGLTSQLTSNTTSLTKQQKEAAEALASAVEGYRASVQGAVDVNAVFNEGQDEALVRLNSMRSGISSLINSYGKENEAVRELINEYNDLRDAMGGIFGLEKIDTPASFRTGATTSKRGGLATRSDSDSESYDAGLPEVDKIHEVRSALGGLSSSFSSLGSLLDENTQSWLNWASSVLSAINDAIGPLATFIASLFIEKEATDSNTESEAANATAAVAASVAKSAAKKKEATANAAAAVTGAAGSVASIPWVGAVLAVAAIASVVAALASIPKYANGGIAYGPTLGIFGEYAGAQNNPEVVAPLDRLRSLLDVNSGTGSGKVEFEIKGRRLVGVLNNESNHISRR